MVDTQKLILSDLADTLARDSAALDGLLDDLVRENAALADILAHDSAALADALARWRDGLDQPPTDALARDSAALDGLLDDLARESAALEQLLDNLALDIDFDALFTSEDSNTGEKQAGRP